jgi:membrane fusion protein (multidrug efflux system)
MKKIGVIIAIMVLFVGCQKKQQVMQNKNYPILTIQTSNSTVKQSYSASIQGKQDVSIFPQVSGTIKKVCVKEGEKVRQGQVLFVIDQTSYKAALNVALSGEKTAKANVSTMLLEYNSKQELYKNKVVSEYDLKKAENNLLSSKASLSEAQANVVNARNNLSYTTITSPSNGVIGTINYRQGALVSSSMSNPLTIVSNNSETYVYFLNQ